MSGRVAVDEARRMRIVAGLLDALLPDDCLGCGAPGAALCGACIGEIGADPPRRRDPTPRPAALPPVTSAGPYAGTLRAALLSYKERGRTRLAEPLGALLAAAVLDAWRAGPEDGPITVVGVPSTRRARHERGHCHVETLAASAVGALRQAGIPAVHVRALRRRGSGARDSATLSAVERAANGGAFVPRRWQPATLVDRAVIVVDDIVTTGATAAATTTALQLVGARVVGVAAVATTTRRVVVNTVKEV
jgi:predicted amidophosphoribosyltransferase